jgi:hypothetical protein
MSRIQTCWQGDDRRRRKQSQRDCSLQPKVASSELPWEMVRTEYNPNGPTGVAEIWEADHGRNHRKVGFQQRPTGVMAMDNAGHPWSA